MSPPQPYISSLADRTGWTEGQILALFGAALAAVGAAVLVAVLRAVDAVFDALPGRTSRGGVRQGRTGR